MSIVKKFIEKNASFIENMSNDNPDLSNALMEALATMGQFIEEKNIEFTEEQENMILASTEPIIFEQKLDAEIAKIDSIVQESQEKAQLTPATELKTWGLLQLVKISSIGLKYNFEDDNFSKFWDNFKVLEYNDNPSRIPTDSYDKYYFTAKFSGRVSDFFFTKTRLDISVDEYNPFTSENILFDNLVDEFVDRLQYCYYGFGKTKTPFGSTNYLESLLMKALPLFNFDWGVLSSYFVQSLKTKLQARMQSSYWNKKMIELKDSYIINSVKDFDYSPEIQERFSKIEYRIANFTIQECLAILKEYMPKEIFGYLFEGETLEFTKVYDLAWFTPNEDGDVEYMKMQLGMPFDFDKAYGFSSTPLPTTGGVKEIAVTETPSYESENLPRTDRANEIEVGDILKKVVDNARFSPYFVELVDEDGVVTNVEISYDINNVVRPYIFRGLSQGGIKSLDAESSDNYSAKVYMVNDVVGESNGKIRKITIFGEKSTDLDDSFQKLKDNFKKESTPTQVQAPITEEAQQEKKKRGRKPKQKVAQTITPQETQIEEDEVDLSHLDLNALEDVEDIDLDNLDELLKDI